MAQVLLFNHIPKTAGSTMHQILWRTVGKDRLLLSTRIGRHREDVAAVAKRLEDDPGYAIAAHTGYGLHERLPAHDYRQFTLLRDPVERTVSEFFYARDDTGKLPGSMTIEEFLETETLRSYNAQTAFLGGFAVRHHLDGEPLRREDFDGALLEGAKSNLEAHAVVGLAEEFNRTLWRLRREFSWPVHRIVYRKRRVGKSRVPLKASELAAVEANNQLDQELYDFAKRLFHSSRR